jgi:hypothetical protein
MKSYYLFYVTYQYKKFIANFMMKFERTAESHYWKRDIGMMLNIPSTHPTVTRLLGGGGGACGRGIGHAVAGGDPNHSVGAGVGAGVGTDEKVITLLPVPLEETATNNDNSGDQQTERHTLSAAEVIIVQVIPSDEVITLLVEPVEETATNNPNSGDQQTEFQ